jgi:hypothetical protein
MTELPLLLQALRAPASVTRFSLRDWDLLLRQASGANVAASLASVLAEHALLPSVPEQARRHLEWITVQARRHRQSVAFEVDLIGRALAGLGVRVILLKGAAYASAGLPAAGGRMFADVDILVPRERLGDVESALMVHGWVSTHLDDYDQRYYREWMHELPPMENMQRGTLIDVHHAILPLTSAARPDPAALRAAALPLAGQAPFAVLAPTDMVLHSAVHLFYDGELDHGVRDLLDMHRLLQRFGETPDFWPALAARARELELARPLFYALRYANALLDTPVPAAALAGGALSVAAGGEPPRALRLLMDALFLRALLPNHASCNGPLTGAARFLLYVRANWLRMPPLLLARHLFHKAFLSPRAAD